MPIHIIIDGYNLIRQSPSLQQAEEKGLQDGRDALVRKLAAYRQVRHIPITVVFDGTHGPAAATRKARIQGIDVCFSPPGTTADTIIKQMAAREKSKALVVSSDQAVACFAESRGAAAISSQSFDQKLSLAVRLAGPNEAPDDGNGWKPTTRKKGPSRRPSRRMRRRGLKMDKL
jgi:hypothetical protein